MADDITDVYIATEAGDAGWQSLSALAAEQVDAKLPIESDDGTVKLDSPSANTFTVSTGGSESFRIAANKDATFQGHVGVMSPAFSTASIALQGEVKPINVGGAFGLWVSPTYVVDPDAAYAKHARAFASVKAPANGQAFDTFTQFYASAVCGNTVGTNFGVYVTAIGAINNVGCCVTKGGAVEAGNWGFYDNTGYKSFLQGGLQTPSVSGIVDSDASIAFGAELTVNVDYDNTTNTTSVITFRNINATQPNAPPLEFFGRRLDGSATARLGKIGFVVEADQPFEADNGYAANFCVWSQIGANPYYHTNPDLEVKHNGNVVINNGQVKTPSVSGLNDSDAAIELGAELLTINHTPTQPNSIATKQTVDDKIWVGTTAQYNAISTKNTTTLYCLTD